MDGRSPKETFSNADTMFRRKIQNRLAHSFCASKIVKSRWQLTVNSGLLKRTSMSSTESASVLSLKHNSPSLCDSCNCKNRIQVVQVVMIRSLKDKSSKAAAAEFSSNPVGSDSTISAFFSRNVDPL